MKKFLILLTTVFTALIHFYCLAAVAANPGTIGGNDESKPSGYYYYCDSAKAYYPSVATCPEAWVAVPLGPPSGSNAGTGSTGPFSSAAVETINNGPNALSLEVFGRALVYSLNYDRILSDHFAVGIGISSWEASQRWVDYYQAAILVLPLYVNYYFTDKRARGYLSAGMDIIHVSTAGSSTNTFENNGVAAVLGGGYEYRDRSGFFFRLGAYVIVGRSVGLSPAASLGIAF